MAEEADTFEDSEALVELAYRWSDIEEALPGWHRKPRNPGEEIEELGTELAGHLAQAFRVEAHAEGGFTDFSEPWFRYEYVFFSSMSRKAARQAADTVRGEERFLLNVMKKLSPAHTPGVGVRVVSVGTPSEGQVCGRPGEPPPKPHIDVSDVPDEKPESSVPLTKRDGYWLTPIEVPFYDALRDTGVVFAVQPWIQGVERRYRLDFLVFYGGGMVAVELDGHESHKSKDDRERDARRDRWFAERRVRTLRWTGSEVTRNPQECVRQLLGILRGEHARP
jgi:very-short-patch-repair endonuclease